MTIDQLLAELEAMLAARRERKMGDYKLVPAEPTAEMTLPYDVSRCTGRMDDAHWCKQRYSCQRYRAFSERDKQAGIPAYRGMPVGMAVPACENKIEVSND